jgi:hypothetical protein
MLLLSALLWQESTAHACDATKLTAARDAVASAPNPDQARRRLASAVAGACTFPTRIQEAFKQIPSAAATDATKIEIAAMRASPSEWTTACPAGPSALEKGAVVRGVQRRDALYDPCNLLRFRFSTSDEFAVADGYVFLAIIAARHFQEVGVEDRVALPILRTLAGVDRAGAAAPAAAGGDVWATARMEASSAGSLQWGQRDEAGWGTLASELLARCDELARKPPAERSKNRQVEFDVCAQAGRAASNAGLTADPHVREIKGQPVVVGYWAAALIAQSDDMLVQNCRDAELKNTLAWYLTQVRKGEIPATR